MMRVSNLDVRQREFLTQIKITSTLKRLLYMQKAKEESTRIIYHIFPALVILESKHGFRLGVLGSR